MTITIPTRDYNAHLYNCNLSRFLLYPWNRDDLPIRLYPNVPTYDVPNQVTSVSIFGYTDVCKMSVECMYVGCLYDFV